MWTIDQVLTNYVEQHYKTYGRYPERIILPAREEYELRRSILLNMSYVPYLMPGDSVQYSYCGIPVEFTNGNKEYMVL